MKRWIILVFGLFAYAAFVVAIAYGVAFFGNLFVARTIDAAATVPLGQALLVDIGLLALFALQHSGMARPRFKAWMSTFVPPEVNRSTYVLLSSVAMIVMMTLWQPLGGVVWSVDLTIARQAILVVYFLGWMLMIWATFLIDHCEMFGLRQVWCRFRNVAPCREPDFGTPAAYRYVRHPIYAGWLVILWASPIMTVSHLVMAAGLTFYVLIGVRLEERELGRRLPYYEQYCRKVPMLLPSIRKRLADPIKESHSIVNDAAPDIPDVPSGPRGTVR